MIIKCFCANCREWSEPEEISIATNDDDIGVLIWYCAHCRRYNDIELGETSTRI